MIHFVADERPVQSCCEDCRQALTVAHSRGCCCGCYCFVSCKTLDKALDFSGLEGRCIKQGSQRVRINTGIPGPPLQAECLVCLDFLAIPFKV